ncbi:unnamed protein product [Amoebophrya sp. A25]|nr:unnamed protein product [Amoebophrya sp. A25]|eukprot:GSA25T00015145001.1
MGKCEFFLFIILESMLFEKNHGVRYVLSAFCVEKRKRVGEKWRLYFAIGCHPVRLGESAHLVIRRVVPSRVQYRSGGAVGGKNLEPTAALVRTFFRFAWEENDVEIRVVGSCPQLGSWDPLKGVKLETSFEFFPVWISKDPVYLPLGVQIDYRYAVITRNSSGEGGNGGKQGGSSSSVAASGGGKRASFAGSSSAEKEATSIRWVTSPGKVRVPSADNSETLMIENDADEESGCLALLPTGPEMTAEDDGGLFRKFSGKTAEDLAQNTMTVRSAWGDALDQLNSSHSPRADQSPTDVDDAIETRLQELEEQELWTGNTTVLVIAFQLPVKAVRSEDGKWAVTTVKSHVFPTIPSLRRKSGHDIQILNIGWPGVHVDSEYDKRQISDLLLSHNCVPVFPNPQEFDNFVRFSHDLLWPVFHDVMTKMVGRTEPFDEEHWASYQRVNHAYADVAIRHSHEQDLFWVHNYHLMLCPQYLTRKLRMANIGFFLHTTFPSFDIFRSIPCREELLRALLCSDLIGFQFFDHARKFFVCVKRLLGLDWQYLPNGQLALAYVGRDVCVKVSHTCISAEKVASASEVLRQAIEADVKNYKKPKVITAPGTTGSQNLYNIAGGRPGQQIIGSTIAADDLPGSIANSPSTTPSIVSPTTRIRTGSAAGSKTLLDSNAGQNGEVSSATNPIGAGLGMKKTTSSTGFLSAGGDTAPEPPVSISRATAPGPPSSASTSASGRGPATLKPPGLTVSPSAPPNSMLASATVNGMLREQRGGSASSSNLLATSAGPPQFTSSGNLAGKAKSALEKSTRGNFGGGASNTGTIGGGSGGQGFEPPDANTRPPGSSNEWLSNYASDQTSSPSTTGIALVSGLPLARQHSGDARGSTVVQKFRSFRRGLFFHLREDMGSRIIFTGIDRSEALAGTMLKMRAWHSFLTAYPSLRNKVVLIQCAYPSVSHPDEQGRLFENLEAITTSINDTFGHHVLLILSEIDRDEKLALLQATDVLLDTQVKDGMNLCPLEFLACRSKERIAPVIVSEFSGVSQVLQGAVLVNPWNTSQVIAACAKCCRMSDEEKRERFNRDWSYVCSRDPFSWVEDFLVELRAARKKDDKSYVAVGFGANFRLLSLDTAFTKLYTEDVIHAYRTARGCRVFLLDNEGTLAPNLATRFARTQDNLRVREVSELNSYGAAPSTVVLQALNELMKDPRNIVVVISGRTKEQLDHWFSQVPKIGLAAEHGFCYRIPPLLGEEWVQLQTAATDFQWKQIAFELMKEYSARTQGSFMENKGSALVWQYREADPEFGDLQAKELGQHLREFMFGLPVEITNGKGYVEVKLAGINKGAAVSKILQKVSNIRGDPDFVLCMGDDRSDENMFEVVNQLRDLEDHADPADQDEDDDKSTSDCASRQFFPVGIEPRQRPPTSSVVGGTGMIRSGSVNQSQAFGLFNQGTVLTDGAQTTRERERKNSFISCTIGQKPSKARHYLHDVEEVTELLAALEHAVQGCLDDDRDRLQQIGGKTAPAVVQQPNYAGGSKTKTPLDQLDFGAAERNFSESSLSSTG